MLDEVSNILSAPTVFLPIPIPQEAGCVPEPDCLI
jgi:hypothetical protein